MGESPVLSTRDVAIHRPTRGSISVLKGQLLSMEAELNLTTLASLQESVKALPSAERLRFLDTLLTSITLPQLSHAWRQYHEPSAPQLNVSVELKHPFPEFAFPAILGYLPKSDKEAVFLIRKSWAAAAREAMGSGMAGVCTIPKPTALRRIERHVQNQRQRIFIKIREELIITEKNYAHCLSILLTQFLSPMEALEGTLGVDKDQRKAIFNNISVLYTFHHMLLSELENSPSPAPCFVKNAEFMQIYISYITGYLGALTTLNEASKSVPFQEFLAERRASLGLDLMAFLILPLQRIPCYVSFLSELREVAPLTDPLEVATLSVACFKMNKLARQLEASKRECESMSKLMEIQHRLKGQFTLLQPNRHLVREGNMLRMPQRQLRGVFLFSDLILWTTKEGGVKGKILLANARVTAEEGDDGSGPITLTAEDGKTSFSLSVPESLPEHANTEVPPMLGWRLREKLAWLTAIRDCIAACDQRNFEKIRRLVHQAEEDPDANPNNRHKAGWMTKLGGNSVHRRWQRRYFVLNPDGILTYFESDDLKVRKGTIMLSGGSAMVRALDPSDQDHEFTLAVVPANEPGRTYYFACATEQDYFSWLAALTIFAEKEKKTAVREGYLTKRGERNKTWKLRYFILDGHTLRYFKNKGDRKCAGEISMFLGARIQEEKPPSERGREKTTFERGGSGMSLGVALDDQKHVFSVSTLGGNMRTYILSAGTRYEMDGWMAAISLVVQNCERIAGGVPRIAGTVQDGSEGEAAAERRKLAPRSPVVKFKEKFSFLNSSSKKLLE